MNPLGVLCARDVLTPTSDAPEKTVAPETDIRDVMKLIGETGSTVGVMEDGKLIGEVTKERVLSKLLDPRS